MSPLADQWVNSWAVSQQSMGMAKVKLSQPLDHMQDIWRTFRSSHHLHVLSGWMWLVSTGMSHVSSAPCSAWIRQLISSHAKKTLLDSEQNIPAECCCCFIWPYQQLYNLSVFSPRRRNHSFGTCWYPECNLWLQPLTWPCAAWEHWGGMCQKGQMFISQPWRLRSTDTLNGSWPPR